ncbi:SusF/SusE family outer membrane protein [Enterococcus cecorum]|uniref:InlB B-repeat-containing protein n=1 Tax=Enterococcus cecorum TaxID=44008 RepID=UPI0007621ACC|nr:SusF/SusE family outer membrane protein [Enterococcus cecorum]MDZ5548088.1 SusF/SusE family outer membrane protein [Enterococcus cecorum]MDZ5583047.1 SusF/SusE family outer membrane protein [Enterococcus cecorum]MDZ5594058.1 SusF/SusE family outer membrane protein [Enterococcus cecorum]CAI3500054.1 SusF/SusE family outer membrane protein [Enterococcus cecorum]
MKKMALLAAVAGLGLTLAACGNKDAEEKQQSSSNKDAVQVSLYDGNKLIKNMNVDSAKDIIKYEPKESGKSFMGWYLQPDFSREFTADGEITPDLKLYAGFSKYQDDTREFIILGNGNSEVLKSSNWGANVTDEHKMKKEDNSKKNIYTLTVTLQKGDEFQFAKNGKWENQRGAGYLEVTTKDGEVYFESSGGLGETSSKQSNIKVAKDGVYTFKLETHPNEDVYDTKNKEYNESKKENFNSNPFDVITWTYKEK